MSGTRNWDLIVRGLVLAALVFSISACSRDAGRTGSDPDLANPYVARARARLKEGDKEAAIRLFEEALDDNPRLAGAHLDLGLLLQEDKKDLIGAVYHYRRYLELRPHTDNRETVENRIRMATRQIASEQTPASAGQPADGQALIRRILELREENAALRLRLRQGATAGGPGR